jgi:hypothetical protein
MDYYGHATQRGACAYIAMERQGGLGARIRAWKSHHQRPESATVYFIPQRFSLFQPAGAARLLDALKELPEPVRFVGVDTGAKAILPGNENETRDMGQFMENLQRVAETGPNVLIVHHLNASGSRERGNTSFRGDVDTLMMVAAEDGRITLTVDKVNELAEAEPIVLRIVSVLAAESATVDTAAAVSGLRLTRSQLDLLVMLRNTAIGGEAATTVWLKASGLKDRTFYDLRKRLVTSGYVRETKEKRPRNALTLAGESAITANCGITASELRTQEDSQLLRDCGGLIKAPASAVQSNGAAGVVL